MGDVKTCHFCGEVLGGRYSYYWSNPCHTACLTKTNAKKKDADEITALLARLEAERDDLASALDSIEAEHSISTNGNVWRFWRDQAREMAQKAEKAEKAEAALAAAYHMGLEAGAKCIEKKRIDYQVECGIYDSTTGQTEYPGYGEEWVADLEDFEDGIRALPVPTSAEILAQIEERGE